MPKTIFALVTLFMLVNLSCQGSEETTLNISEDVESIETPLEGESSSTGRGDEEEVDTELEERESEEGPAGPVTASWVGFDVKGVKGENTLALQVTNISHFPVTVRAELICEAFVNKSLSVTMPPGELSLPLDGTAVFEIPANKLPIQVLEGAGSLRAKVHVVLEGAYVDDEPVEKRVSAVQMYYRHNAGFNTMDIFSTDELVKNYDGMVVNPTVTDNELVGRIMEAADTYSPVYGQDQSVAATDEDGNIYGTTDGASIEIEYE